MKQATHTILAATALALALTTAPVTAEETGYIRQTADKLGRGFTNSAFGWAELFKNLVNEPTQKGWMYAPVGLIKGVGHTVGRTVLGGLEFATFFIPTPAPVHPEYIWQNPDTETSYGVN